MPWVEIERYGTSNLCRKEFRKNKDVTNWYGNQWVARLCIEDDDLTKEVIQDRLNSEEIRSGQRCVIKNLPYVGLDTPFTKNSEAVPDLPTRLIIGDVDIFLRSLASDSSLRRKNELLRSNGHSLIGDLGCVLLQSSKAGLRTLVKDGQSTDVSERFSTWICMLADEALTQAEWKDLLQGRLVPDSKSDFYELDRDIESFFDLKLFNTGHMLHYCADPVFHQCDYTKPEGERTLIVEGSLFPVQKVRDSKRIYSETVSGHPRQPGGRLRTELNNFVWKVQYDRLLEEISKYDWKGQRHDLLNSLYYRVAFTNIRDLPALTHAIHTHYSNFWNSDWNQNSQVAFKALSNMQRWYEDVATGTYLGLDPSIRAAHGWEVREVEEKVLTPELFNDVQADTTVCVAMDCGGGKTEAIARMLLERARATGRSATFVTPYKILAADLAEDDDVVIYTQYGESSVDKEKAAKAKLRVWVHKSLQKIPPNLRNSYYLYVDEATHVSLDLEQSDIYAEQRAALRDLHSHASVRFYADAEWNDSWMTHFISLYDNEKYRRRILYMGMSSYAEGMNYYDHSSKYSALAAVIEALNAGERVYFSVDFADSNNRTGDVHYRLQALKDTLVQYCPGKKILAYDKDNAPYELRTNFSKCVEELVDDGLDCLLLSPVAPKGVSYIPTDDSKDFDVTCTWGTEDFITAWHVYQQSRRGRRTTEHHYYISNGDRKAHRKFWNKIKDQLDIEFVEEQDRTNLNLLANDELLLRAANKKDHMYCIITSKGAYVHDIDFFENDKDYLAALNKSYAANRKKWKEQAQKVHPIQAQEYWNLLDKFHLIEDNQYKNLTPQQKNELNEREILALRDRANKIEGVGIQSMLDTMKQSPRERELWQVKNVVAEKQFRQIYGAIFDVILSKLNLSIQEFETVFHWISSPTNEPLVIKLNDYASDYLLTLVNDSWRELTFAKPKPHLNAKTQPAYSLKWLCEILDLTCSTTKEPKGDRARLAVAEKRQQYPSRYLTGLSPRAFYKLLDEDIATKRASNYPLTELEKEYLATRDGYVTIRKKKYMYQPLTLRMAGMASQYEDSSEDSTENLKNIECFLSKFLKNTELPADQDQEQEETDPHVD